ncbi:MAG: hydrogenase nickel incorporation protein HypB [Desulfobulbaceae bacterium]|nr:hydrogenase nickel incorporation protein HypB [Desulfobulbaceae bacterium]
MKVNVVRNILDANDRIASENREIFDRHKIFAINLMSSPGAGKTTLLEALGKEMGQRLRIGVIEGDIQSSLDAERVAAAGLAAVQIETAGACHLDANMIRSCLGDLDLTTLQLLVVENVGNLVCPAEFNTGEHAKVMLLSVTEGDDKPLKYPLMFRESRVLLISKIDLLPHVRCDVEAIKSTARSLNPEIRIIEISSYTGQGLEEWHDWLAEQVAAHAAALEG